MLEFLQSTAGVITSGSIILGAIIGVWRFMSKAWKQVTAIHAQLIPNGGSSLRDAVDKALDGLDRVEAMQRASMQLLDKAYWYSDPEGKCEFASDKLATIMGVPHDHILGYGWVSSVAEEYRVPCRQEWDSAVADVREFRMDYGYVRPDGSTVLVKGFATPVIHPRNKTCIGMIGWVELRDG